MEQEKPEAIKPQDQVKVWRQAATRDTYEKAAQERDKLKKEKGVRGVKIHKLARGFVVKVWEGHMQGAPLPANKG